MAARNTARSSVGQASAGTKRAPKSQTGNSEMRARAAARRPVKGSTAAPSQQRDQGTAWAPSLFSRAAASTGAACRGIARWAGGGLSLGTLIVSLVGLADAAYLTYQHFSHATAFAGCSGSGTVNCEAVTTSAWSYLFGTHLLPVSVLGLAFFAFMTAVNSPWGWRAPWPAVHWARLAAVVAGIALVLYLIWAELFRINAICLYCTGVHILTFILFALIVGRATFSGLRPVSDDG
jgi:uncharacterized membrane protein